MFKRFQNERGSFRPSGQSNERHYSESKPILFTGVSLEREKTRQALETEKVNMGEYIKYETNLL